ncbi:GNAT family N-acetyltransferase [Streptomyces sp. NPDC059193]|uniref:GNAT family N-acetyltransferase n=1 Tax=Streptomyces sp. NPDC059193 TaxID=3346763 RepID=UPI0036B00AA2
MNTLSTRSGTRIRTATLADADTVVELASLVDLHLPSGETPAAALAPMRGALTATNDGPLSHRLNHFLIAETPDGLAVGLIVCGPPNWIYQPGRVPGLARRRLAHRIATVHNLAVRPDHRRRGIAAELLRQTEGTFRDAGYAALTLRHDRSLTAFYERQGYTSSTRLSLMLPTFGLITVNDRPWKHAFKNLAPEVAVTTIQGLPTITGLLPD